MEYGSAQNTAREKQTELVEAHIQFQELGKRLDNCLARLTCIGNKLSDESGQPQAENVSKEPSPRLPGLTSDIYRDIDGFKQLTTRIEHQLAKLEGQI